jgi:hypothetical protein
MKNRTNKTINKELNTDKSCSLETYIKLSIHWINVL